MVSNLKKVKKDSIRDILFWILSLFLHRENIRLKKMKKEINQKLYLNTLTQIRVKGDIKNSPPLRIHRGKFSEIISRNSEITYIKVLKSEFFAEIYGEPNKEDLNSEKTNLYNDIAKAKSERSKIMSLFLLIFFAIFGYLLKIIIYDKDIFILALQSAYYSAIVVGLFINYITQNKLISRRRKSYRAHLSLLYLEDIYPHLTSKRTTTNKNLSYDDDGLQKNVYSTTYLELMTILLADITFVALAVFGLCFFN